MSIKMIQTFSKQNFQIICDQLAARDSDLAAVIKAHGYPPMWKRPNSFEALVHIILEQQVSLASALAALKKLQEKLQIITPQKVLTLTDEELKACYVSRQKTVYIRGLAEAIIDKRLILEDLKKMADDDFRSRLISLKGIGNWTTDIYLMFVLQRADIFPIGDLAAVNALKKVKNFTEETTRDKLLLIAENWQPYRTIATMILWHYYLSSPFRKG